MFGAGVGGGGGEIRGGCGGRGANTLNRFHPCVVKCMYIKFSFDHNIICIYSTSHLHLSQQPKNNKDKIRAVHGTPVRSHRLAGHPSARSYIPLLHVFLLAPPLARVTVAEQRAVALVTLAPVQRREVLTLVHLVGAFVTAAELVQRDAQDDHSHQHADGDAHDQPDVEAAAAVRTQRLVGVAGGLGGDVLAGRRLRRGQEEVGLVAHLARLRTARPFAANSVVGPLRFLAVQRGKHKWVGKFGIFAVQAGKPNNGWVSLGFSLFNGANTD